MRLKSFALLLLLGIVWGSGYSIARFCVTHGVPPLGYSFWQSLGPALVLLLLMSVKAENRNIIVNRALLKFALLTGLIGLALPNSIMYFGSAHLPSSIVAILVNTVPLFVYPLALLFKRERFAGMRLAWVLLGVMGLLILNFVKSDFQQQLLPWSLIVMIAPLCFALCVVLIQPLRPVGFDDLKCSVIMMMASSILLTPVVLVTHSFYALDFHHATDYWILVEISLSSFGYVIFFRLLALAGPVYYSLVGGVIALTGVVLGILIFKETLAMQALFGLLLILCAIVGLSVHARSSN